MKHPIVPPTTSSPSYRQAKFLVSSSRLDQCPLDEGREIAFAGRSNAGKSTAINRLTQNKSLARTSKTPGRTQLINFFDLGHNKRLVDLPGYGYARVPKKVKQSWSRHLDEYLRNRQSLRGLILVMDSRHPLKPFDEMLIQWSVESVLPLHVLLTKSDKLKKSEAKSTQLSVSAKLSALAGTLSCQLFSGTMGAGLEDLEQTLNLWFDDNFE